MTARKGAAPAAIERVEIYRVVKTFGAIAALRGVTTTLRTGRLTLIEGANGSGKTTLLRIVGTVLKPTSGEVDYPPLGDDLNCVRSHIGWVSHESLAYGDLSGRDNVQLAARLQGLEPDDAWERIRERFQLGAFAARPLRTMSRGQRQRIALARALAHRPGLLLLDEPTTGLDRSGVERLLSVVGQELDEGAGVVVVSHDPGLFEAFEHDRIVLERGKVVDA